MKLSVDDVVVTDMIATLEDSGTAVYNQGWEALVHEVYDVHGSFLGTALYFPGVSLMQLLTDQLPNSEPLTIKTCQTDSQEGQLH
jgi:hypothetical protein